MGTILREQVTRLEKQLSEARQQAQTLTLEVARLDKQAVALSAHNGKLRAALDSIEKMSRGVVANLASEALALPVPVSPEHPDTEFLAWLREWAPGTMRVFWEQFRSGRKGGEDAA